MLQSTSDTFSKNHLAVHCLLTNCQVHSHCRARCFYRATTLVALGVFNCLLSLDLNRAYFDTRKSTWLDMHVHGKCSQELRGTSGLVRSKHIHISCGQLHAWPINHKHLTVNQWLHNAARTLHNRWYKSCIGMTPDPLFVKGLACQTIFFQVVVKRVSTPWWKVIVCKRECVWMHHVLNLGEVMKWHEEVIINF